MNYSNTPLFIRNEDNTELTNSAVNVYDPSGNANSLIIYNNNEDQKTTIQYLNSPLTRVSGNIDTTSDELFAPNIYSANGQDVQVLIPKFRTLRFYNLDGSRLIDPLDPTSFFPDFFPFFTAEGGISYTNFYTNSFIDPFYKSLEWFKATDTYVVSMPNYMPDQPYVYFTGSGIGFASGWYDAQTSAYTGILCSGLPYPISGIYNAINDPTGTDDLGYRKAATYSNATGIVSAQYFGDYTGYARAGNKLVLGTNFSYIPAASISIDTQSASVGKRTIDSNINQDAEFVNGGALQTKISFNSYLNTNCSEALNKILNSTGDSLYTIKLNNNVYSGCYLSNYDINIQPHKAVTLSANYISTQSPEINLNKATTISQLNQKGSTNLLLYSEDLTGSWTQLNSSGVIPNDRVTDPTGGLKARFISSVNTIITDTTYAIDNSQSYTYATITGTATRATYLTSATNADLSTGILLTGSKYFYIYGSNYNKIYIGNNGLLNLNDTALINSGYTNYQNQNFPFSINGSYGGLIAAYWKDLGSSVGSIWYQQLSDRFVVEYNAVGGSPNSVNPTQTFQVHLLFGSNIVEMRYKNVSQSNVFNPNPNIGLQASAGLSITGPNIQIPSKYINYNLASVDLSKSLQFIPTTVTGTGLCSLIYNNKQNSIKDRAFSIHLRRRYGFGPINYTLNSGITYSPIYGITSAWQRFTFPYNKDDQQVGIQIPANGDSIDVYGAQLEDLAYSTDYIPTKTTTVSRADSYVNVDATYYQTANLKTGFVNNMINGNTCSLSNIAPITDIVQNSIKYAVSCNRTPIYNIGSIIPSNIILDSVERQMDINSTDLPYFINYSGSKLTTGLSIVLKDNAGTISSTLNMNSGSYILSQKNSIQEGDILLTDVSIKELIV